MTVHPPSGACPAHVCEDCRRTNCVRFRVETAAGERWVCGSCATRYPVTGR